RADLREPGGVGSAESTGSYVQRMSAVIMVPVVWRCSAAHDRFGTAESPLPRTEFAPLRSPRSFEPERATQGVIGEVALDRDNAVGRQHVPLTAAGSRQHWSGSEAEGRR